MLDPRILKNLGFIIAGILGILAVFGVKVDVPIVDPTFPIE